jgi:uncharacterized protein YjeT (DUF2065 family)
MSLGLGDALTAFGLLLVFEGLVLAAAPETAKRAMAAILTRPAGLLRLVGVVAMAAGVAVVWLVRG